MAPSAARTGKKAVQGETVEFKTKKPFEALEAGWYSAVINSVSGVFYKTGSFGIKFTYSITEGHFKNRKVFDNIVLRNAEGKTNEGGHTIFTKRLDAAGLTSSQIASFAIPKNGKEDGDLGLLKGQPVRLRIEQDNRQPMYKNADGEEVVNMRIVAVAYNGDSDTEGPKAA